MQSAKEYNMMYKLNAQLGSNFGSAFSKAQKSLSETQKQISELNKVQGDVASYQKQQKAVEQTSAKLELYKGKLEIIQKKMAENGDADGALATKELDLKAKIHDTDVALADKQRELAKTGSKLQEAGVDTSNLTAESKRLSIETVFSELDSFDFHVLYSSVYYFSFFDSI